MRGDDGMLVTQDDLFPAGGHDPGGKVRHRLPPGMRGDAILAGANDEYRPQLRRWVGEAFPVTYILWIGMNPSTADAAYNDPTISREWSFTQRIAGAGYWKCNVSDYRATNPKALLAPGLVLQSEGNRDLILRAARDAKMVVCAWGAVNRALEPLASALLADLRRQGVETWCLGRTAAGHPRHPLYVAGRTEFTPF